ncbi:hypothetical protein CBR67_03700 [Bordetella hinzii]|uniref:Gp138 family membrane-puncturing spike protein n=1 Tax=Bordetella hinzii TaxID=103855 RepID=UPI00115374B0|nr:Gp138 family membrane-puncturing spike protein [Bordetella hinzii]QDJ35825.1 hypothetical protein CBR67_03700 [Bordetella hinzii]
MADQEFGYQGLAAGGEGAQQFGALTFLLAQVLGKVRTCSLVRVVAVTNDGGLSPVGFVDVQPMVNQLDGYGNSVPHLTLHQIPYLRVQGGADAVILDPKVGDIGIAVFSDRDISSVKATKDQANPGSWRMHDMADGLYFGGVLNGTPQQYVQFQDSGITVHSPRQVTVRAPDVKVEAEAATVDCETSTVSASASAAVTAPSINLGASGQDLKALVTSDLMSLFNDHTHHENGAGSETAPPTQKMGNAQMTTTIKGG